MALGYVVEAEAFRSLGLDAYLVEMDGEQIGYADAHFTGDGRDFGGSEDEGDVDVDDAIAGVLELLGGEVEEDGGVGVFPAGVARGEEAADVAGGYSAEESVGDGVEEDIAVGVSGQAFRVVEGHAADAQRYSGLEFVGVVA